MLDECTVSNIMPTLSESVNMKATMTDRTSFYAQSQPFKRAYKREELALASLKE